MHEEYNHLLAGLKAAQAESNKRRITLWKNKLEKWRLQYGAHQPIKQEGFCEGVHIKV